MSALANEKMVTLIRLAQTILLGGIGAIACARQLPTETNPCPCASGYVCCASGTCAPDQASCDSSPHPDGSTPSDSGTRADAGMQPVGPPSEQVADIVGSWTGYLESFMFASGSDAIRIDIVAPPGGTASATVVFGDLPPWPAPTDPDVPWPADDVSPFMQALEGFPYVANNLRWETMRLRFTLSRYSPWQDWCALQTPVPNSLLGYACVAAPVMIDGKGNQLHDAQGDCLENTTPPIPVACAKDFPLCIGTPPICTCDANVCNATELPAITFDIALRNGVGDGSTNLPYAGPTNVRLTHTSN